jgi:hypothetical protein
MPFNQINQKNDVKEMTVKHVDAVAGSIYG